MIENNDPKIQELIGYVVEKTMKGVRKQLKGYVGQTENKIERSLNHLNNRVHYFEQLYKTATKIIGDIEAFDQMLTESKKQKIMIAELKSTHTQIKNELMDLKLLKIELENKAKTYRKGQHHD